MISLTSHHLSGETRRQVCHNWKRPAALMILLLLVFSSLPEHGIHTFDIMGRMGITGGAAGGMITVGPGKDHAKIQDAVNAAITGDTVYIYPGVYTETVVIEGKSIRLQGSSASEVTIDGNVINNCLEILSSHTEVRNLTASNGDYGIYLHEACNNSIENVTSTGNQEGIYLDDSFYNMLYNVTATNNHRGIYLKKSGDNSITDSVLSNNDISMDFFSSSNSTAGNVSCVNGGVKFTASDNATICNSSISVSGSHDLNLTTNSSVTLINTSFDKSSVSYMDALSSLTVKWYLRLDVKNTLDQPVEGANIVIKDNVNGSFEGNAITDAGGETGRIAVTEYVEDNAGRTYYQPYNITVAKTDYHDGYVFPEPPMLTSMNFDITLMDNRAPVADAGPDRTVGQHTEVTLNAGGSHDNLIIDNYTWNFTSGGVPVHLYEKESDFMFHTVGIYRITLSVTDQDGNRALDIMNVTVNDTTSPRAQAGLDIFIDQHDKAVFNGTGSEDNVEIVNYTWSFVYNGSGHDLTGPFPSFVFHVAGFYEVQLSVEDLAGNLDSDIMNVTVLDITNPVADAGPDVEVDQGETVLFNATGSHDDTGIINYTWTFRYNGTEFVLFGSRPSFTFHVPGLYTATLRVNDSLNNSDKDFIIVTVRDITDPVADAGLDMVIDQHETANFDGRAGSDNVGIDQYVWTFHYNGSTQQLLGSEVSFVFHEAGEYEVVLNVTDEENNWDTDELTVIVRDITPPSVKLDGGRIISQYQQVVFNGAGCTDNTGISNFTWTFLYNGNNIVLFGVSPAFTFNVPGNYTAKLTVSDAAGNIMSGTMWIYVRDIEPPLAYAGVDTAVDQGDAVLLDASGSSDNIGIIRYVWIWFDNGADQLQKGRQFENVFRNPGFYPVILNVTDTEGNWDTDVINITVRDAEIPTADAGRDVTVTVGENVTLNGVNSSDNMGISNYTWRFLYDGRSVVLNGSSVTFRFEVAGIFNITLEVTDASGNVAEDWVVATVETNVSEDSGKNKEDYSYLWFATLFILLLIVIIGSVVFLRKRSKGTDAPKSSGESAPPGKGRYVSPEDIISGPVVLQASHRADRKKGPACGGPVMMSGKSTDLVVIGKKDRKMVVRTRGELARTDGKKRRGSKRPEILGAKGKRIDRARGRGRPRLIISDSSQTCKICFGLIKSGLTIVACGCGKHYHDTCAQRVGECPMCGFDYSDWRKLKDPSASHHIGMRKDRKPSFDPDSVYIPDEKEEKKEKLFLPPAIYIGVDDESKKLPIDEIFLMTSYGLLIKHYTFNKTTEINEDVLASMLTAVTNFMSDTLSATSVTGKNGNELKKIDYGEITVMFASGEEITIVGMVSGPDKEDIHSQLEEAVKKIEKKYLTVLKDWDGEMKKLDGVKDYMEKLVLGEYGK